jgi:hypothetical protein
LIFAIGVKLLLIYAISRSAAARGWLWAKTQV